MVIRWLAIAALTLACSLAASPEIPKASGGPNGQGNPNARLKIEVFSDYQCPACKTLFEGALHQVKVNYVATGKVYLVDRYYPLAMHAYARPAAGLACAAQRIGKHEVVATALFRQQEMWSKDGNLDRALAGVLNPAEIARVKTLAKDPAVLAEIERDVALGTSEGVHQTPTMIIYSRGQKYPVSGQVTYDVLQRALDSLLAK